MSELPTELSVPTVDLQYLFDMVVQSMDFGSGFMETDDVEVLRRFAVLLGVDPMKATPSEFRSQYPHRYDPGAWHCTVCSKREDHPVHEAARGEGTE
ncbi:hypothetical protein ACFWDN_12985 [Micromonospora chalcea]